jgi:hypothetical protein
MAAEMKRQSPVALPGNPAKTEMRDSWTVVLEYESEGAGPFLIDLSHRTRWDVQDSDLARFQPMGVRIPGNPGRCTLENGILINRMNRSQASIWHLGVEKTAALPDDPAYTDTTDGTVFLAVCGRNVLAITEKLTALDLCDPHRTPPFLIQGPFGHVPCQIVTLEKTAERSGILLTCSRGYARDMVHAILDAGEEFGLQPAGENAFTHWIEALSHKEVS